MLSDVCYLLMFWVFSDISTNWLKMRICLISGWKLWCDCCVYTDVFSFSYFCLPLGISLFSHREREDWMGKLWKIMFKIPRADRRRVDRRRGWKSLRINIPEIIYHFNCFCYSHAENRLFSFRKLIFFVWSETFLIDSISFHVHSFIDNTQ